MPKRDIVEVNYPVTALLIKKTFRSYVVFCEKMNEALKTNRGTKWVSEWKRHSNLPSPEEAACMCILLNTTPEEILLHEGKTEAETVKCQDDIKLVQELVEKEKGIKKAPADEGEGLDPKTKEILEFIDSASYEELDQVFRFVSYLISQRGEKE